MSFSKKPMQVLHGFDPRSVRSGIINAVYIAFIAENGR